ncbi:hypothetical protein [Shewanella livingstonensis]|uniref:Uncharacterized protein n=1 Tax=Shewanella livingstonensis TaxID=150120 RepID=A0A3G8LPJ3_9GAMM|nr:hypothetical protein [Shewanella livingstonensis]AZG71713.1 hypothetical protein EGC82_02380 [Shewanella livingstonensis]
MKTISGDTIYNHLAYRSGGALLTSDEMESINNIQDVEDTFEVEDENEVIETEYLSQVLIENEISSYQQYLDFYNEIPARAFALDLPNKINDGVISWSEIKKSINHKTAELPEFYDDIVNFIKENNIKNEDEYLSLRRQVKPIDRESLPKNIQNYKIDWYSYLR